MQESVFTTQWSKVQVSSGTVRFGVCASQYCAACRWRSVIITETFEASKETLTFWVVMRRATVIWLCPVLCLMAHGVETPTLLGPWKPPVMPHWAYTRREAWRGRDWSLLTLPMIIFNYYHYARGRVVAQSKWATTEAGKGRGQRRRNEVICTHADALPTTTNQSNTCVPNTSLVYRE